MIETRNAGGGTLQVHVRGVKFDVKPVDELDVRTLQVNYNPIKKGEYLITVKWSEKHIPGSPFHVKITGHSITANNPKQLSNNEPIAEDLDSGVSSIDL